MAPVLTLTPTDLEFGKRLTDALKGSDFPYEGVFWLYDDESDDWRLVIVTPWVEEKGRRETYLELSNITSKVSGTGFQQTRITVMSPETPLYRALHSAFARAKSVEGARLRNTYLTGGVVVPEAYLYEIR